MMEKIIINYDDQPNEVIYKVSSLLWKFGLKIVQLDGDDGTMSYEIIKIENKKEK